ncbi:cytochrome P450 71AU50-like [Andrographis paniculata]|uniref:cytochrome P450 71AU50-like n=1 Tax=Andrographis paniculata TaxID=175694 RepID=UPI0021E85C0D|nr:cytochrome P450 71AU50-like [Andrographis paniculata]
MAISPFIWIITSTPILATIIFLLHLLTTSKNKNKNKNSRLPPGPKSLPIIGHLHMLGKNPHQDLRKLAKTHGAIMHMRFGLVDNIVVSSPQAAELFLKTYDLVFASRPPHQAAKYLSWDQSNLSFGPYGPYWRNMRKLCTIELLSTSKINSFQPMRREELSLTIDSLAHHASENAPVDLTAMISSLAVEMSCRMVFGKKYEDKDIDAERGFKKVIQEGMKLAAVPNFGDYFPFLGILDLQGLTRKMKSLSKVFDDFFEKVIDEHVKAAENHDDNDDRNQTKDIVDTMMSIMASGGTEFQFDRRHVKSVLLDMLAASMDTAAASIEWTMSELIKSPSTMAKLQRELEDVVGLDRMVEESDLENLEYLELVVKESLRLHPVAPLLIPHYAMEDCTVRGYEIPKGSRVIVNAYAIGRDPNAWADPDEFFPERFVGSDVDVRGQHFQLLPFGAGRRGCPGMQLGLTQVRLIVSQLVHCFDWRLPDGLVPKDLDMTEEFGLVVARANPLVVVPSLRLKC